MFVYVCIINNFGSVLGNHYIVYKSNAKIWIMKQKQKKRYFFLKKIGAE